MEEKRKLVVDIPIRLAKKMDKVAEIQMVPKSSITKIALNEYCDDLLHNSEEPE